LEKIEIRATCFGDPRSREIELRRAQVQCRYPPQRTNDLGEHALVTVATPQPKSTTFIPPISPVVSAVSPRPGTQNQSEA
jgi:hypothetical protein